MPQISFVLPYYAADPMVQIYWVGTINGVPTEKPLTPDNGRATWRLLLDLDETTSVELIYHYRIEREGLLQRVEPPSSPHTLRLSINGEGKAAVHDYWMEATPWHRYTEAPLAHLLRECNLRKYRMPSFSTTSREAYLVPIHRAYDGDLLLVGADPSIGGWHVEEGMPLTLCRHGYLLQFPKAIETEYKLVWRRPDGEILWEKGDNRYYRPSKADHFMLSTLPEPTFARVEVKESLPRTLTGTAVPLFSLRGKATQGIGDFSAAIELLDWMQKRGQSVLQLLPIYDTTFSHTDRDSYPYSAITTYGLHPIYMDLQELPGYLTAPERPLWEHRARLLDALDAVDYVAVSRFKEEVIELLFDRWALQKRSREYLKFIEEEQSQLLPYALFCAIRDLYPERGLSQYPPYGEVLAAWQKGKSFRGHQLERSVEKYQFIQYHLYRQLSALRDEAHKRGIIIKGDLPIGVSRNSVDVWVAPHLFCLNKEAGSPPDAFSATGQNWGFPTYHWEAMARDGYQWWRQRLQTMSRHFDALRIDHILGFFRIWSIPVGSGDAATGWYVPAKGYAEEQVRGLESFFNKDERGQYHPPLEPASCQGFDALSEEEQQRLLGLSYNYYYKENDALWTATALERLTSILSASDLLLCAEDLGVLPQCIHEVLRGLEIISLEVLRMPKLLGRKFVEPEDIPQLSLVTTSTHDMPSLRGWWQTLSKKERKALAESYHFEEDISPRGLVNALLQSPRSILLVLPLQDWFVLTGFGSEVPPEAERINIPQDPHHVWNYRLPKGYLTD